MSMRESRLEKSALGKGWGLGGRETPLARAEGGPFPPKKFYTCSEMPVPKGARLVGMMPCMAEAA